MEDDDEWSDAPRRPSKSSIKREWQALETLVTGLLALSSRELATLGLDPELDEALQVARGLKRGALQRQIRYARGLLAGQDHAAIAARVAALREPARAHVRAHKETERWRDRLLMGEAGALDQLCQRCPQLARSGLTALIAEAQAEQQAGRAPRAARALFKLVAAALGESA
jgi:ribosome-associated protein